MLERKVQPGVRAKAIYKAPVSQAAERPLHTRMKGIGLNDTKKGSRSLPEARTEMAT